MRYPSLIATRDAGAMADLRQSKLFTEIDTSGDGILQLDEFVTGIEKAWVPGSQTWIRNWKEAVETSPEY